MSKTFRNRVFGCVVIKSVNSNYNADFSHQPRTLPDGTVYATDKALKYTVRNYIDKNWPEEKVFYFKSLNEDMQPRDLEENYVRFFGNYPKKDKKEGVKVRKMILENLMSCLDVRLFGGTFASKAANLSIHGAVQPTHGVNRYVEGIIYSEQIASPFRNGAKDMQTTLGTQFKLKEGHYVHHFSVNPGNLDEVTEFAGNQGLTQEDIAKLKEALRCGATFYDSSAKAGTENEVLLWVELKEGSKLVLPSLVDLVIVNAERQIDFSGVSTLLQKENIKKEIAKIELYYNKGITKVSRVPEGTVEFELNAL